jgi:hypothetical protein
MSTPFQAIAAQAASQAGIDANIFIKQIQQESGFNQWAKSPAGAEGIAQFMPSTAMQMGVDPWNVQQSLTGAATLDARNLKKYNGDYTKMLAAYNCGGGCVDNAVNTYGGNWLSHTPGETQNYVNTIMGTSKPTPGTGKGTSADPCLGCGAKGSAPYLDCLAKSYASQGTGALPSCANGGTTVLQDVGGTINDQIAGAFKPLFNALPSFGIHIALFFGALMLVIVGLWVLTRNPVDDAGSTVNTSLNNAATRIVGGSKE